MQRMRKRLLDVHVCELPKKSDSNLPKLPPNARFYTRWKRNFQKIFLVCITHPLTRNYLRSLAAVAFEKRRHGRSTTWWVIHPCSNLRYYWDFLMTFTFLYMFIAIPYILAFHRIAKSSDPKIWNLVYPAYIICLCDIGLNMITGFESKDGHEIFLDPILIIQNYMKGYFFFDLISSIPYVWFYQDRILPPGPNSNSLLLIPEFLPLLKIIRIFTLRHYIGQILHTDSDMYLITSKLYEKSDSDIYLMYFHIGMSNIMTSTCLEFYSLGKMDMVTRCILLLFGKGCIIYFLVIILQLIESAAEAELKYQQVIYQVKEYIHQKKFPENLKKRLIDYYEYRFQGSYFKENAIYRTLSNLLNQEIMMHSTRGLLDTATILHHLPRSIIGNLMEILKPVIYLNEDIIYKSKTEGDCMFFIVSGTVALITFSGKEICHEKDGGYFGEAAIIFPDRKRLETVIALEVCELVRLDRRDFKRMFPTTSILYKRLENVAKERYQKINKLERIDSVIDIHEDKIDIIN
ncbi:Potassium/sodium hyperpolarization-activated cyclic nucleotide-gated channel [Apis cerana cerana]|uniref:Potassium/sodium hyperpolarization-activated cyclic nucleotide-gated channel n=1 Tax=Apis cerana cerana TaxID=94128 RepID=A0A2A3E7T9_APICC|nr:Potassium/sodium hyperpolarization-activated cyclic nucleotide-gated channel [Apis cerana cerana]